MTVTKAQIDAARHLKGICQMRNPDAKLRELRIWIEQYCVIASDETFKRACMIRDKLVTGTFEAGLEQYEQHRQERLARANEY